MIFIERTPRPGEFYRHFKDKLYQIVTIAEHTETGEAMVVYQALYGDFSVYVRPLSMFVSPVDREKYPDAVQKYRFERVEPTAGAADPGEAEAAPVSQTVAGGAAGKKQVLSPLVVPFVEAESYEQKLELLVAMRGSVSQEELDVLTISLDLPKREGSLEQQLGALEQYLKMQLHFDGGRLR